MRLTATTWCLETLLHLDKVLAMLGCVSLACMMHHISGTIRVLQQYSLLVWHMCRGYEEGGDHVALANSAIGACISSIGPQVVLQVAPIDVQDLANCNTWVLPLLRKHTRCTQMSLWGEYLLPRARAVGSVAIKARDSGTIPLTPPFC